MKETKIKSYPRGVNSSTKIQPRERQSNFLKYWRIVRYYIKRKYDISLMELDMLLYLYDTPIFKKEDFNYYGNTMSWDKKRFYEMISKGLIKEWRPGKEKYGRSKIYELTHKGKSICSLTYKKLLQEEPISEDPRSNPLFKNENYMDKIYNKVIQKMNSKSSHDND
jgi:uncharacterized protein YqgQ|tara:strand:+ start:793 stop:1290 length:498 start_codon:yes stop_codon:yes gene_type:complete